MERRTVGEHGLAGKKRQTTENDAAPRTDAAISGIKWTLDWLGQQLIERDDIREQLALLATWPGRVSGWRRAGALWLSNAASGQALIFGVENAPAWRRPGTVALNPASVVGNPVGGSPPALRSVTLNLNEVIVCAAVCAAAGVGSLVEMTPAEAVPGPETLLESFPAGRGDAAGFDVRGETFDHVRPVSLYIVNSGINLETAVLLADSTGAPRGWMRAEHFGEVPPTLGISRDNTKVCAADVGSITQLATAFHCGEIRRVVRGLEGA